MNYKLKAAATAISQEQNSQKEAKANRIAIGASEATFQGWRPLGLASEAALQGCEPVGLASEATLHGCMLRGRNVVL